MQTIAKPYIVFLGNAKSISDIKTATGIYDFCPQDCLAEFALANCQISLGLKRLSFTEAKEAGIKTLIIGAANSGGYIDKEWLPEIKNAIKSSLNIVSGLHEKLNDNQELVKLATENKVKLIDIRQHDPSLKVGTGEPRSGKRILTVGTDCNIGKMYTAYKIYEELKRQGKKASFRATGQTGIIINGDGIAVDAVIADFISGAVERISPDNDPDHYDVIEGQGTIFHPAYSGVSLGLLHGARPDYLVLCHEPTRQTMRHCSFPIPKLSKVISLHLEMAKLINNDVKFLAIALNLSKVPNKADQERIKAEIQQETNLLTIDPKHDGVTSLIAKI